eukprot:COSAG01_NODE_2050_length_8556_cov_63.294312_12_plen_119_part_00
MSSSCVSQLSATVDVWPALGRASEEHSKHSSAAAGTRCVGMAQSKERVGRGKVNKDAVRSATAARPSGRPRAAESTRRSAAVRSAAVRSKATKLARRAWIQANRLIRKRGLAPAFDSC